MNQQKRKKDEILDEYGRVALAIEEQLNPEGVKDENIENALAEVFDIIAHSDNDTKKKIPVKFIKFIKEHKNSEYEVNIDYSVNINDQKLLDETRSILALIYKDYLKDDNEEDYEIKWKKITKAEKYENDKLMVKEEIFLKKIIQKIRNFFSK